VDEVILPEDNRPQLCRALLMLRNKRQDVPSASTEHPALEARKIGRMQWNVAERVGRVRWIFLPLASAPWWPWAHASADVVGDRVLWPVEPGRRDSSTGSVGLVLHRPAGGPGRVDPADLFARAVALAWELAADALIAIPMLATASATGGRVEDGARPAARTRSRSGWCGRWPR